MSSVPATPELLLATTSTVAVPAQPASVVQQAMQQARQRRLRLHRLLCPAARRLGQDSVRPRSPRRQQRLGLTLGLRPLRCSVLRSRLVITDYSAAQYFSRLADALTSTIFYFTSPKKQNRSGAGTWRPPNSVSGFVK